MLLEERALLADLNSLLKKGPDFISDFKSGDLSISDQHVYAHHLMDISERLTVHAEARAWVAEKEH